MPRGFTKVVDPGVAVGVEVQQGQRLIIAELTLALTCRTQQRQGDGVIPSQKNGVVLLHQLQSLCLDVRPHLSQAQGVGQAHVTCIAHMVQR